MLSLIPKNPSKSLIAIYDLLFMTRHLHVQDNRYRFQDHNVPVYRIRVVYDFVTRGGIATLEWPAEIP